MKKLNKKGFVLAESIVVSVFVLGIFTYLAVNVIPLVTQYDRAINYDNPQEVYAANILAEELISSYYKYGDYGVLAKHNIINRSKLDFSGLDSEKKYFEELLQNLNIEKLEILYTPGSIAVFPSKEEFCKDLGRAITEYCYYMYDRGIFKETHHRMGWLGYNGEIVYQKTILLQFNNNKFAHFVAYVYEP